jgi:hypothetical protein
MFKTVFESLLVIIDLADPGNWPIQLGHTKNIDKT